MKKQLLSAVCLSILLLSSSAFAASPLSNVKVNVNMPKSSSSSTSSKSTLNTTKLKNQIAALDNNLKNISTTHQNAINNITNILLPKDQINELKADAAKLKQSAKDPVEINIDIAEDGTAALNTALKKDGEDMVKKLNANQKAALKKNIATLKSVKSSYTGIATQATDLASTIKAQPVEALAMAPELISLGKTAKEAAKQTKDITKLTIALTKAGIK